MLVRSREASLYPDTYIGKLRRESAMEVHKMLNSRKMKVQSLLVTRVNFKRSKRQDFNSAGWWQLCYRLRYSYRVQKHGSSCTKPNVFPLEFVKSKLNEILLVFIFYLVFIVFHLATDAYLRQLKTILLLLTIFRVFYSILPSLLTRDPLFDKVLQFVEGSA